MIVALIAAVSNNGVIGAGGKLPWHLPADLKQFKKLTMGHHLILGRKTFESIGRILPGRRIIVVSRNELYSQAGVTVASSLKSALLQCQEKHQVFVGGGSQIYDLALPLADQIFLTRVNCQMDGDTYFPIVDWSRWRKVSEQPHPADQINPYSYSFLHYERIRNSSEKHANGRVNVIRSAST